MYSAGNGDVPVGKYSNRLAWTWNEWGCSGLQLMAGYISGTPTAYDRVLATRFGIEAIDAVHQSDFGTMVALRGSDIIRVPLADAVRELKTVDRRLYDAASVFFG